MSTKGDMLYTRLPTAGERREQGVALREAVPLAAHADLHLPADRRPALELLQAQDATRMAEYVPIRYGRMMANPFSYFRGAAAVMASDLATTPWTTAAVQLCGDAHLANFGLFYSAERRLVFDVNDFDETLPGPFEWDVKRLATSCVLAGQEAGFSGKQKRAVVREAISAYFGAMNIAAAMSPLELWYFRLDYDSLIDLRQLDKRDRKLAEKTRQKAGRRTSIGALAKLTDVVDGRRIITSRPPLVVRLEPEQLERAQAQVLALLDEYLSTLQPNRRTLLRRYSVEDVALKVVGVGSVGTRCLIVLLQADEDQPLFLQLKEAGPSVLENHLGPSEHDQAGQRVVTGQQEIQATSDVFLGWASFVNQDDSVVHYYFRQLWDGKYSPTIGAMSPEQLEAYGRLCGVALARAHARSGHPAVLAGYLGDGVAFTEAIVAYASAYAKLTVADHAELVAAVEHGDVHATPGV
jgi:uncharacterized protein (DUF2252 family)